MLERYYLFLMWIEALASCALEGNRTAIELLELQKDDPEAFIRECVKLFSGDVGA